MAIPGVNPNILKEAKVERFRYCPKHVSSLEAVLVDSPKSKIYSGLFTMDDLYPPYFGLRNIPRSVLRYTPNRKVNKIQ